MTDRKEEIRFLRLKAAEFRALTKSHPTPLTPKLLEIAAELEAYAAALESQGEE